MKAFKRIAAGVCFMLLLVVLIVPLGRDIHPSLDEEGTNYDVWDHFYAEDEDSINAMMIGSSAIYRFWIPTQAYEEQGFTSFLLATQGQPFAAIPYIMEETAQYQDCDLFVVEVRHAYSQTLNDSILKASSQELLDTRDYYFSQVAASMKPSFRREAMVLDVMKGRDLATILEWSLPLLKYHENNYTLTFEDRLKRSRFEIKSEYKTDTQISEVHSVSKRFNKTIDGYVISDDDKRNIDECVEMADKLGKKLLFVATPYNFTDEKYSFHTSLSEYMKEKGYPYLDMTGSADEIGLSFRSDYYDSNHTNILGAQKVTTYLADYIAKNYEFNNVKLTKEQREEWQSACAAWDEHAEELCRECEDNRKKR